MKLNYGFGSRSRRVVQDSSMSTGTEGECSKESCWERMPPEILRDVLRRVETSECNWPPRKSVVACAGVCRNWREIIKEVVCTPEISGKITFPISVKQPAPRDNVIKCFIKRDRATQTYQLYLNLTQALAEDGKFLLAARKFKRPTYTDYIISLKDNDISKKNASYIGKLRSNFLGTNFVIYDGSPLQSGVKMTRSHSVRLLGSKQFSRAPAMDYAVAQVSYELNVLGSRGPRKMHCVVDGIPASAIASGGIAPTQIEFCVSNAHPSPVLPFFRSKSKHAENTLSVPLVVQRGEPLVLRNKAPRWHEQLHCWCLNFHGRVTVASVKNFQLVASPENGQAGPEHEKVILQFGKVGKDVFTMDYRYPISAFQAFALCLSSFDTKIACE